MWPNEVSDQARSLARSRDATKPTNSMRSVCNGALRLHAARGTHVANIDKTLRDQRAFFCFHRADDSRGIEQQAVLRPAYTQPRRLPLRYQITASLRSYGTRLIISRTFGTMRPLVKD